MLAPDQLNDLLAPLFPKGALTDGTIAVAGSSTTACGAAG